MSHSFHYRLAEQPQQNSQRRTSFSVYHQFHDEEMPFASNTIGSGSTPSQFLSAPNAPMKKRSIIRPRDEIDEFLSSELELSFASTMSLTSPSRDQSLRTPELESPQPMDISPAPPTRRANPIGRPRASTTVASRTFGTDLSNASITPSEGKSSVSASKRTQRTALPFEWMSSSKPVDMARPPASPDASDAMDVDTSFSLRTSAPSFSPRPVSAAPTVTNFENLFYDDHSPRYPDSPPDRPLPKKQRRSTSPAHVSRRERISEQSSSPAPISPTHLKLQRKTSALFKKPCLQGLGNPSALSQKRPRRPALSAMVNSSEGRNVQSAYLVVDKESTVEPPAHRVSLPPPRRAFSAMLPPTFGQATPSDDDSSFGRDESSPAHAYAKRQSLKTIRRCDGTEDFRPLTGATAMMSRDKSESPAAKMPLPGFGDNEALGKVLPCHRVREDGLMRINADTLNDLLDGKYDRQISDYCIIDCRFDYEYEGGHIPGAININTTSAVEEVLLGSNTALPIPTTSGDPSIKTVLIFHCEFSAKRAPTFAKHLRSNDRTLNNHVYPKVHYPELYILEGGYHQYFKDCPDRCEPSAYVPMDDPAFSARCNQDLDQFRKARFGRTRSYAYGEGPSKSILSFEQPKRNTAPSGSSLFTAAANIARSRRGTNAQLSTLKEDTSVVTASEEDEDTDPNDSPCPAPTTAKMPAMFKGKALARAPLARAETYGPIRMAAY